MVRNTTLCLLTLLMLLLMACLATRRRSLSTVRPG